MKIYIIWLLWMWFLIDLLLRRLISRLLARHQLDIGIPQGQDLRRKSTEKHLNLWWVHEAAKMDSATHWFQKQTFHTGSIEQNWTTLKTFRFSVRLSFQHLSSRSFPFGWHSLDVSGIIWREAAPIRSTCSQTSHFYIFLWVSQWGHNKLP